jgi:hypothetical protein
MEYTMHDRIIAAIALRLYREQGGKAPPIHTCGTVAGCIKRFQLLIMLPSKVGKVL